VGSAACRQRPDGTTLWIGSQKPHFARDGVARALGLPQDKVHGIWVPGPGSYGRNDAGDAGIDAALPSKAIGRPVRVQGIRYEGHGWDPKGPASIHRARAALDKGGAVVGYVFEIRASRASTSNESDPVYSLAGQLMGLPLKSLQGFGVPAESYGFANKQLAWETIAPVTQAAGTLRGTARDTIYEESGLNMPRADRTLDRMRSNPRDWRIASLETVATAHGVNIRKPGGSHEVFEHPGVAEAISVPARRPIKPVYVRRFVAFIEAVRASNE